MTIFHILKYTISIPPTKDELKNLPPNLYIEWLKNVGWNPLTYPKDISYIYNYYKWALSQPNEHRMKLADNDIKLLKQMIKDLS